MNELTTLDVDIPRSPTPQVPRRRRWHWARVAFWVGIAGLVCLFITVMSAAGIHALRESHREECSVRLRRVGLALRAYQAEKGHFPAPSTSSKAGTHLLSWRVALLPYLGQRSLYERFHLNEPWDSPHNLALIKEMPTEFACPGNGSSQKGRTRYQVVVGPESEPTSVNTPFEPNRGVDIREITDSVSNTILVFEASADVPWTKPEDLRWNRGAPLPLVVNAHPGGSHACFANGATQLLKPSIRPELLQAILTINGGEVGNGDG